MCLKHLTLVERLLSAVTRDPQNFGAEALKKLLPLKRFIVVPVRAFGHGVLFGRLFVFIYVTS